MFLGIPSLSLYAAVPGIVPSGGVIYEEIATYDIANVATAAIPLPIADYDKVIVHGVYRRLTANGSVAVQPSTDGGVTPTAHQGNGLFWYRALNRQENINSVVNKVNLGTANNSPSNLNSVGFRLDASIRNDGGYTFSATGICPFTIPSTTANESLFKTISNSGLVANVNGLHFSGGVGAASNFDLKLSVWGVRL